MGKELDEKALEAATEALASERHSHFSEHGASAARDFAEIAIRAYLTALRDHAGPSGEPVKWQPIPLNATHESGPSWSAGPASNRSVLDMAAETLAAKYASYFSSTGISVARDFAEVVLAVGSVAAAWQPIETAPEGEPILVFVPRAHRGLDSCEVVVVCRLDDEMTFWTNGGPNGGSDFHFGASAHAGDSPTHWMRLPLPPRSPQ